jgi:hypothetical protein
LLHIAERLLAGDNVAGQRGALLALRDQARKVGINCLMTKTSLDEALAGLTQDRLASLSNQALGTIQRLEDQNTLTAPFQVDAAAAAQIANACNTDLAGVGAVWVAQV